MKWMKLFEDFKNNNEEGTLITADDIRKCIRGGGVVYATIVKDFPNNDPDEPLNPVDIDEDGLITVDYDGNEYSVRLKDVERYNENASEHLKTFEAKSTIPEIDEIIKNIEDICQELVDLDSNWKTYFTQYQPLKKYILGSKNHYCVIIYNSRVNALSWNILKEYALRIKDYLGNKYEKFRYDKDEYYMTAQKYWEEVELNENIEISNKIHSFRINFKYEMPKN